MLTRQKLLQRIYKCLAFGTKSLFSAGTVSCHASGPPKRPITKLLRVKMKLDSDENCIGLKFGPLLIIEANFSRIGQLLYY